MYSITDMEKLSGVKAHTLRMWERRHDLLHPKRSDANIRYYDDDDLQLLLNVCILNREGHRISSIAKMSPDEINEAVAKVNGATLGGDNSRLDVMMLAILRMDEYMTHRIIQKHINDEGFEQTMLALIYPMLEKISLLWITGSLHTYHEHFINYLIRQKLLAAIDALPLIRDSGQARFLLYLPEEEAQELNLLFIHYLLRNRGYPVTYLGNNNRLSEVGEAAQVTDTDYVFTIISENFNEQPIHQYIDILKETFAQQKILLTGYQVFMQNVQSDDHVQTIDGLSEMLTFLASIEQ